MKRVKLVLKLLKPNFVPIGRKLIPFDGYNSQRNHVTKIIRQSKQKYYATKFKRVRDSIKDTWNTINSVFHRIKSGNDRIVLRDNDRGEINDPTEVSNIFGYFFSNVALKGAATHKSVKNCKNVLLHINILEPFTNHGKVKNKSLSQLF